MITRNRIQNALYVGIAGLTLILAACGGGSSGGVGDIEETGWVLTELDGTAVSARPPATIFFAEADDTGSGESFGSTGCNSFTGTYTVIEGSTIELGPFATTLAACVDAGRQARETAYLAALDSATSFSVTDGILELSNGSTTTAAFASFEPTLAGTSWDAIAINNGAGGVVSALPDVEVTADFDESIGFTGSGGCNSFASAYRVGEDYDVLTGGSIEFASISSTRKACEDSIMEQEANYYAAIEAASVYIMRGFTLELRDTSGALQVQFNAAIDG